MTELKIPIITGTAFELTRFDFSFKRIKIYDIQTEDFEKYIESLQPDHKEHNFEFVKEIIKDIHFEYDKKYAIVNENPREHYDYQDLLNVWRLLLIIYPSDLQIEHIISYYNEDGIIYNSSLSSWGKRITGNYPGDLLIGIEEDVPEINDFARKYFDRLNLENYIGLAIENYLTSFSASHLHYQYVTLCIALETIISGNFELRYRLLRSVAVLCGKDPINCDIVFDNLSELLHLRNIIVHGEKFRDQDVIKYLPPLKAIVSRTIIELIIHNIATNKELNEIITRIGFGDRAKITETWKGYRLNVRTIVDSNWIRLTEKKQK